MSFPRLDEEAPKISAQTRILFLARRYPPSVGGIETHCYELYTRLVRRARVRLVALGRQSLLHLAWFLPYCFWVSLWAVLFRRVDVVYFSDGVTGFLAPFLRPFGPARFALTIYGLEMTYGNPLARALMRLGARTCGRVAVISQNTRRLTAGGGVSEQKLRTIYLGVEPLVLPQDELDRLRRAFEQEHGLRFGQDRVLLNFGRQVRRKGVAEFIEQGMPLLQADIRLVVGGRGPCVERIEALRRRLGLEERVLLLGPVADDALAMLRASADLFLMPNIHVPNDVEGFGQTQLECMHAGTPVVAFAVDALVESIREGGFLIEPGDYRAFAECIHAYYELSPQEREARRHLCCQYVRSHYSWDKTTEQYLDLFEGRT